MEPSFELADKLYNEEKFVRAFNMFLNLAEGGDVSAMTRLALMFDGGIGVEANIERSMYWDEKAAELGDPVAMVNLGLSYKRVGRTLDAVVLFEKALKGGFSSAALEIAEIYAHDDTAKARYYADLSLKRGSLSHDEIERAKRILLTST